MSRHRNIRTMRYSDEYDGYDDEYGHSVEEDYSMSPSDAAFMYDRSSQQHQLSSLIRSEDDIAEEDEAMSEDNTLVHLKSSDKEKIMTCLDELRNVLGEAFSESELVKAVVDSNFDTTVALDKLLNSTEQKKGPVTDSPKPQRDNVRPRGRGGRTRVNLQSHPKISPELKENSKSSHKNLFDVLQLLNCDRKCIELDLFTALVTNTNSSCVDQNTEVVAQEKTNAEILLPMDHSVSFVEEKENMFVLQNMSVRELKGVIPSKLGYYICKKLIEVHSNCVRNSRKTDFCNVNIVPFKFDCKSPDDIALGNRKWKY